MPAVQTTAWKWPWEADPTPPPAPAPAPQTNRSPEQSAQRIIERYWRWQDAGAKTAPDPSGDKDPKTGQVYSVPVDPDTGAPDANFPSDTEISAAEALLTRKQSNDPAAVQAAKDQAKATLDETRARTAQVLATTAKGTTQPQTVQPGEGVWNPATQQYDVPVPTKAPGPAKSQAQIDQEAADAHAKATTDLANTISPAQAHQNRLDEITAQARASANAAIAEKQALIDSGIELSAKDQLELKSKLDAIAEDAKAKHAQEQFQFEHDLQQPNVEATRGIAQQQADTATANQQSQEQARKDAAQQADINQQTGVLEKQGAAGQSFVDQLSKAGIAASSASLHMAVDPLMLALHLSRQAVAQGIVPPSAMPTPSAPVPAGPPAPPSAPMPAPQPYIAPGAPGWNAAQGGP